jgi:type I restriction enzyme S subunit
MGNSTLGENVEIVMGQSPPGSSVTRTPKGLPLLNGPTEFGPYHPTPVQFTTDARKCARPGDILFCVRGSTTGRMNWADREYAIGRGIAAIRHHKTNSLQPLVRAIIEKELVGLLTQATGSTFPNVTASLIGALPYPEISEEEQFAIAHILGSLDEKIELNHLMIGTLEAMAHAIFKSWFVDFDPVSAKAEYRSTGLPDNVSALFPDSFEDSEIGKIPSGWESRSLYNSAKYINGAAYRSFHFTDEEGALPVVKIAELKNGVTSQTKFTKTELDDKYRIRDGDILLSWSGNPDTSIGTFVWCGGAGWLNQHIFRVLPYKEIEKHFIFYLLKHMRPVFAEIARDKQTTGLGHFTARDMKRLMVVHPPEKLLAIFNNFVGPIFNRWYSNLVESDTLISLRDALLPKLISGELRVPNAEKFVKEAGL